MNEQLSKISAIPVHTGIQIEKKIGISE